MPRGLLPRWPTLVPRRRVLPALFPRRRGRLPRRPALVPLLVRAAGRASRTVLLPRRAGRGVVPVAGVVVAAPLSLTGGLHMLTGQPRLHARLFFFFFVASASAAHPPAPAGLTSSPAGWPVDRSVSSAPCKINAAAAMSTTGFRSRDPRPPCRSASCAITVVYRSSTSRTGVGPSRATSDVAKPRAAAAAAPSCPDRPAGRPTTTSIAPCSATSAARVSRSPRPRRIVASGLASVPPGSHRATPIRAEPTSTANRTPALTRPPGSRKAWPPGRGYGCSTIARYAT